mgnify:CR=1 FL=1
MVAEDTGEKLQLKPHVPEILDWLDQQDHPLRRCHGDLRRTGRGGAAAAAHLGTAPFPAHGTGCRHTQDPAEDLSAGGAETAPGQTADRVVEDSLHALEGAKNGGFFTIGIADPENAPVWKEICATATVHIHDILDMKQFF